MHKNVICVREYETDNLTTCPLRHMEFQIRLKLLVFSTKFP